MDRKIFVILIVALIALSACSPPAAGIGSAPAPTTAPAALETAAPGAGAIATATAVPAATTASSTTAAPAATPVAATAAPASGSAASADVLYLTLQPDGTQAGYKAHEQLASKNLPSDAIGTTSNVTGTLAIRKDGTILADQSQFVLDMATLHSDSSMRDGYVRGNVLQTSKYPKAVFVPSAAQGLPSPLPTSGDVTFKLSGNLTVHGVTKQVTWDAQGKIAGNDLTGTATTAVVFEDFGMSPPRTMMVLSVEDNLVLTIKFHLRAGAAPAAASRAAG
jgi:polyisoprenoid-binding protein YceI